MDVYWLKNKKFDHVFFILSPIVSLVFVALYFYSEKSIVWILPMEFIFSACLDQPHIFLTFARTHLDEVEFSRHVLFHTFGIIACIAVVAYMKRINSQGFYMFFQGLGSFHIYRQNIGFFRLYGHKQFELTTRKKMEILYTSIYVLSWIYAFIDERILHVHTYFVIMDLLILGGIVTLAKYDWKSPPVLLMLSSSIINWIAYAYISQELIATAIETAYHNVQYFGFMFLYMSRSKEHKQKIIAPFFIIALVYGVGMVFMSRHQGAMDWSWWVHTVMIGIVFYHYIIEAFIWKFRNQPELQTVLVHQER